ncbi:hypothetical protein K435DRAFT_857287 [Dendrothele bispora CBS 962.96]|uniref:Uncharacterized protein n=1 Tax=Dendrothele bispora (strain CBS 962.96) TaxID=1314807 RepID=A0A4S8M706_DENBC|nr:hypothetical protein K435DRAFT_857287 [Dendrothele bispora CBS 962.96]
MYTTTEMVQSSQSMSVLLPQLDDTQSRTASTVAYYTLVALVIIITLFRLRYPCLTLSGLREFVDYLDGKAMERERLAEGFFNDVGRHATQSYLSSIAHECFFYMCRLQEQIEDIEYQQSTLIFRWSSVHEYLRSSVIIIWNIAKCYEEAQELNTIILAADKRRSQRVQGNHRHDTNVDVDRSFSTTIGHISARFENLGTRRSMNSSGSPV